MRSAETARPARPGPTPPPGPSAPPLLRRGGPPAAALLAAFALVAVVMTFPWPTRLGTHVPGDAGDALFVLWVLDWVADAAPQGWNALWDAPAFHPAGNVLAYSDSLLSVAPVHWLLAAAVGPVVAFNLVCLASWTASSWWTYRLALRVTGAWGPSVVGALAYTYASVRLSQYGHFQLLAACLLPAVLLLLMQLLAEPRPRTGLLLGLTLAALATWASYYAVLMGVATAVVLVLHVVVVRPRPLRPLLVAAGGAVVVAAVLVAPVAWRYVQLQEDPHFRRGAEPALAAHPSDFLAVAPTSRLLAGAPVIGPGSGADDRTVENRLFPGFVAAGFGAVGVVVVLRDRRRDRDRRTLLLFGAAAIVTTVLAFGEEVHVGGATVAMPYALLRDVVPGLAGIRAPARFVVLAQCVLAVFAAVGLTAAARRLRRPWPAVLVVGGACLVLAETALGVAAVRVPTAAAHGEVNALIAARPPGVVAELPMLHPGRGPAWAYVEAPRQLLARDDGRRRANGYSGFAPPRFDGLAAAVNEFPSEPSLQVLDDLGVRYVVLRTEVPVELPAQHRPLVAGGVGAYTVEEARRLAAAVPADRLARVDEVEGGIVVELAAADR